MYMHMYTYIHMCIHLCHTYKSIDIHYMTCTMLTYEAYTFGTSDTYMYTYTLCGYMCTSAYMYIFIYPRDIYIYVYIWRYAVYLLRITCILYM